MKHKGEKKIVSNHFPASSKLPDRWDQVNLFIKMKLVPIQTKDFLKSQYRDAGENPDLLDFQTQLGAPLHVYLRNNSNLLNFRTGKPTQNAWGIPMIIVLPSKQTL